MRTLFEASNLRVTKPPSLATFSENAIKLIAVNLQKSRETLARREISTFELLDIFSKIFFHK